MTNQLKKYDVFEILDKVCAAKTKKDKINILREYDLMPVRDILQGMFDDRIQWNLPGGVPPYTPNRPESVPSNLMRQHLKFKFFVKGLRDSERLSSLKRERMFIDLLETVHPKDAELVLSMVNKTPLKGLTKTLVQEAFPDLIP
jgi:hypothetical protein